MKNILYLASQSSSRKALLTKTDIPFLIVPQSANEQVCDWTLSLEQVVKAIALHKMDSLDLSLIDHTKKIWVLTADTLGQDSQGHIYGKPVDYADAVRQIKNQRDQWARVATSFCLDRKAFHNGVWITEKRHTETVVASIRFCIQDSEIDAYLAASGALSCAGSITIDDFGAQYLKEIQGSYSCVIGLPLFELRRALHGFGFFDN